MGCRENCIADSHCDSLSKILDWQVCDQVRDGGKIIPGSSVESMKKNVLVGCCVVLLLLSACSPYSSRDRNLLDAKQVLFEQLKGNLLVTVSERISKPSAYLLQGIKNYDRSIGMEKADQYVAYLPTEKEMATIKAYIDLLPRSYQSLFERKLVAVFFVDNFSGAGMTEWLVDRDNNTYYFMVLNSSLFKTSLDDWLTRKENSFFDHYSKSPRLEVHTATIYSAIMYALLHEGAHLVDFESGVTPYVDILHGQLKGRKNETSTFSNGVWQQQMQPSVLFDFKHRKELNPYGEYAKRGLIPKSEMKAMFAQLIQTPFVGFYSGMSWNEDFADFMTYQILEKKLGGVVKVDFLEQDKVTESYRPVRAVLSGQREYAVRSLYD